MTGCGYLGTNEKSHCFGCEACAQACHVGAIKMIADEEGFRYPEIDQSTCLHCGKCRKVCPAETALLQGRAPLSAWGGYSLDQAVRSESTSGGLFSVLADAWCDADSIVFGAMSDGLKVRHSHVRYGDGIAQFRKSKYLQSEMGTSYRDAKNFLDAGCTVLFSGTPCQIAGLRTFLGDKDYRNLLSVEVVCEGVPTPHYITRFAEWLGRKKKGVVKAVDYRFKDGRRWDFQVMQASLQNPTRGIFKWKQDRWFNPFWSIWLQHLISRPACYECPFATGKRLADITMGDLWGVHLYCPELYGRNGGASVVFCNTPKGCDVLAKAAPNLYGHDLPVATAIRYQGPMRKHIALNPRRTECMADIRAMPFEIFVRKYAQRPSFKLLFQKYVWGNRQKVWLWSLINRIKWGSEKKHD